MYVRTVKGKLEKETYRKSERESMRVVYLKRENGRTEENTHAL